MKFSVRLSEILKQLKAVAKIASSGSKKEDDITLNILMKVEGKELSLKSTDYNIELEAVIPLVDVESEGVTSVNASKLMEVCSRNNNIEQVKFELDENSEVLIINSDNTVYEIRTRTATEFPGFPEEELTQSLSLKQKQLKALIDMSIFCVSTEDFRDYLRGVRFEAESDNLSVFSSDGHRMACLDTKLLSPVAQPLGALLTRNCAEQVGSIIEANADLPVELKFSKNVVSVKCNGYTLKSKLINVSYPNVRNVIPQNIEHEIVLPRKRFVELINRVSVLSSKRINGITMNFGEGKLSLRSENKEHEVATHTESCSYTGPLIEISLNHAYVNEVLNHLNTDDFTMRFPNPLGSVLLSPAVPQNEEQPADSIKSMYLISKIVV
ncbi:MAG: DNA polymerase III subunit beta [Succinivibrio sp.]|jgi:DNA polymerase-3 subunit beta|nr:DNA polymerase III subunit beta [Succinivibrio sp.]